MIQGKSIIINTIALYVKIIISGLVTFLSTRVALDLLGVNDFGLYNLVAGIIAMLSFLNGSLLVSTQRFLSVAMGKGDNNRFLSRIFNSSLFIHLCLMLLLLIFLLLFKIFLFSSFLNIDLASINVAKQVYNIMIFSSLFVILTIPYNAAINAHEEMWMFAIIESFVAILKLLAAYSLYITPYDLLLTYSILMSLAIFVGGACKYLWCRWRYVETRLWISGMFDFTLIKKQMSFVGWNTLGSIAMLGRNQGIAIVLNVFWGTLLNAAYGVANQLNVLVSTFASTITTVFNPIIMKYKGQEDNDTMLYMASLSSKVSFLVSSVMALPLLLELDNILSLWLTQIPEYTLPICTATILTFVIMQLYPGITRAIYAEGNIKWYQIITSCTILLTLPVGYILFKIGYAPPIIVYAMVVAQFLVFLETLYFAYRVLKFKWQEFIMVVTKSLFCFCFVFILSYVIKQGLNLNLYMEIFVISSFSIFFFFILFFLFVFSTSERKNISKLLFNLVKVY